MGIADDVALRVAGEGRHGGELQQEINSDFIRKCLEANEIGDGTLYTILHRDKVVHDNASGEWLLWGVASWKLDRLNVALANTSAVVELYLAERHRVRVENRGLTKADEYLTHLDSELTRRVKKLQSNSGRAACLQAAISIHEPLAISGDELDAHPMLLACKNAVVDLSTGIASPGDPRQYITKACPTEWTGLDTPAPRFERYLDEIFAGDIDKITYVVKLLGYAITGSVKVAIFPVLYGKHGRNGKTTLMEILFYILGPLAGPIPTEMLLRQKNGRSAAGPSPDIMALRGLRIAVASEPNEGERFDMGRVKKLSGSDTLEGRNPHDKYLRHFMPSHTLFLLTNEKPGAKYDDMALWERMRCIDFPLSFVSSPDPAKEYQRQDDNDLLTELKAEASGILALLVRGCMLWQKEGLIPPKSVREVTDDWRLDEDVLHDFIAECLNLNKAGEEKAGPLHEVFGRWWETNVNKKIPSSKKFGEWMREKFSAKKSHGLTVYTGVSIKVPLPERYRDKTAQ